MGLIIEVHLYTEGTGLSSRGRFSARNKKEIPNVIQLKHETRYRKTLIEKVIVNGTEDITDKVKEIENKPIPLKGDIFL